MKQKVCALGFRTRAATNWVAPVVPPPVVPPTQAALQPLSYHVNRTASKQLPVYQTTKRGGNLRQTKVRKIEGNIQALREEMRSAMGLQEEHIAINHLTKHILIKVPSNALLRTSMPVLMSLIGMAKTRGDQVPRDSPFLIWSRSCSVGVHIGRLETVDCRICTKAFLYSSFYIYL